jgi:hypothetical protein
VNRWTLQIPALLLAVLLGLTPELALAQTDQQSTQQQGTEVPTSAAPTQSGTESPAAQSPTAAPANNNQGNTAAPQSTNPQPLPDAPSAQSTPATQSQSNDTAPQQTPEGTAAAQAAKTKGGAASKPAGAAIAPAKQGRTRSLLIKMGVIAGAGVALGSVYALTRGSPARPPGAH